MKSKGERERYTHLNAEFQRIARRDKKAFLSGQCKEIEENDRMEKIMKSWQEYTKLYKNDLRDPDNYDGVITHLEPDILQCEVKCALGSITTNKAGGGGDGIPVELFQNLQDDAVKVLHPICQQIWKTQQGPHD